MSYLRALPSASGRQMGAWLVGSDQEN